MATSLVLFKTQELDPDGLEMTFLNSVGRMSLVRPPTPPYSSGHIRKPSTMVAMMSFLSPLRHSWKISSWLSATEPLSSN